MTDTEITSMKLFPNTADFWSKNLFIVISFLFFCHWVCCQFQNGGRDKKFICYSAVDIFCQWYNTAMYYRIPNTCGKYSWVQICVFFKVLDFVNVWLLISDNNFGSEAQFDAVFCIYSDGLSCHKYFLYSQWKSSCAGKINISNL